jgi:hypothetical protein
VAKRPVKVGSTSQTVYVFIQDSTSTAGAGKTGLAYNTSGLTACYVLQQAAAVAITLVTQTVTGGFTSGGFKEVDATKCPGVYRLDVPDAAFASGNSVIIFLVGATGAAPCAVEIALRTFDDQSAGLTGFERTTRAITIGTVGTGSSATAIVTSSLTPAASVTDQFKGRIVTFDKDTTTAALRGQATDITGSSSGGVLTVTALTTAPVSGDTFTIT